MDMTNIGGMIGESREVSLLTRVTIENESNLFRGQINRVLMNIPNTSVNPTDLMLIAEMHNGGSNIIYLYPLQGKISSVNIPPKFLEMGNYKTLQDRTELFDLGKCLIRIYNENIHQDART